MSHAHRTLQPSLRLIAAAAILAAAGSAQAVEWSGYFRGGPAATNVSGESRQCYGLNGPALKYRLGNECDFYGEFTLTQPIKADGVEISANLMTNFYSPETETGAAKTTGIEQAYAEIKGLDFAPKAVFWMGKKRDRNDVHIVDTFFVNMSGVGAGVSNIDLGNGAKFGLSAYKTDDGNVHNGGARIHADFYDIGVNAGGKLRVIGTVSKGDSAGGVKGTSGTGLSLEHTQDNFMGWGGANHIWAQVSQGSTPLNQGFGDLTAPSSTKGTRLVESFTFQQGGFGGQTIAMWEQDKTAAGKLTATSLGGRISYAITKNVKWLTELGLSSRKPDGGETQNLTKLTVGPALTTGADFWKRPELRFYVTQASFNKAAAADASNGLPAGKTSATSFGTQIEIWF